MPPQTFRVIIAFVVVTSTILFGKFVAEGSIFLVVGLIFTILAGLITFLNPENGLILLVFSMLLSPEIELAKIPGRSVTIRIDDLLLLAVFLAYLSYHAVTPHARKFVKTPIGAPLIAMVLIYFVSTAVGNLEGRLRPLTSMFFVLKYVQYFILYWVTVNIINSQDAVKKVLIAGTLTAIVVTLYAYSLFPTVERVYPPFDVEAGGIVGEAGTLGGYYLIVMSLALSFFMNYENKKIRYFALGLFLFMFPPFVRTLSRASYYSLAAVIPALILFSPKRKMTLLIGALIFFALAPLVAPGLTTSAVKRLQETFTGPVSDLGIDLELSAAARVESWKRAFTVWLRTRPIIGYGVTGVGLVDAQFPRIIGELGLAGFFIFIWLLFSIFKSAKIVLINTKDDMSKSIATGFLAALVGLLVQSVGVNTFIIVRIMQPFWFLTAIVMVLERLETISLVKKTP